jgi:hypothetical protein
MKRDINNKLTFFLNDEKIREVLFYWFYILYFLFFFSYLE